MKEPQKERKLTPREADFVAAYVALPNATKAALKSGSPPASAAQRGYELLSKKHIQKAIEAGFAEKRKRNQLEADDVLQELKRLAFFDPRKLFDQNGEPLPIQSLDDNTARAIAGIEVATEMGPNKVPTVVRKYKIASKNDALDKAMRHLGLFKKDNDRHLTVSLEDLVAGGEESPDE